MKTHSMPADQSTKPHPAARGRALVEEWRKSNLSRAAFARQRDIGVHLLTYWVRRLSAAPITTTDFIQVASSNRTCSPAIPSRVGTAMDIIFPRGAFIRVRPDVDPELLRAVLSALEDEQC